MDKFTASNGVQVAFDADSLDNTYLAGRKQGNLHASAGEEGIVALREFFQAERDEALGRWRDPEHPGIFAAKVGDNGDVVQIVKEEGGTAYGQFRRNETYGPSFDPMRQVAAAYFAAHPEPKPWHDARAGEAWVLTVEDLTPAGAYVAGDFTFRAEDHTLYIDDPKITSGRRIWPEPE